MFAKAAFCEEIRIFSVIEIRLFKIHSYLMSYT